MTDDRLIDVDERLRAAVVGGGISGLTAAYLLSATYHVTLFESEDRLGGHAHTHDVETSGGTVPVDSGFIVLNDRTYPLVRRLFGELGVETRPTEMSMSVSCHGCGLSYKGGVKANGIFAQRRRLLDPTFWRFLLTIRRFQKQALALLEDTDPTDAEQAALTYGEFLERGGYREHFVRHYALPVVSCVWSMGYTEAMAYPAAYLFAFLRHHGFLTLGDAPTWHTVVGGSRSYVRAITDRLDVVHVGDPVTAISRKPDTVEIDTASGAHHSVDKVVVATHADTALALLTDADESETALLGSFGYSTNTTLLHRDAGFLPTHERARASWNYRLETCDMDTDRTRVTYWMNKLQGHPESDPLLVTLNPEPNARPADVVAEMSYQHPTYTAASVAAQSGLASLNDERVAFAGAYHGWGFHEDGCRSGVAAAQALGARW